MSSQRYQPVGRMSNQRTTPQLTAHQVNAHDDDSPIEPSGNAYSPTSPPPSFRSRDTSPTSRRLLDQEDPMTNDAAQDLDDAFGDGSDDEEDDRQRLMRGNPDTPQTTRTPSSSSTTEPRQQVERRITELPAFRPPTTRPQPNAQANDGVFANLGAKLERGEQVDEKPPVSIKARPDPHLLTIPNRHTNKPQPTPPPHTGKPQSSPPTAYPATKSTSTASPSAPSSPSSGTA
jgi:hypothetical protein